MISTTAISTWLVISETPFMTSVCECTVPWMSRVAPVLGPPRGRTPAQVCESFS